MTIDETVAKIRQKNYELNIQNFKLMFNAQDNEYSTITKLFEYHDIIEAKNYIKIKYHTTDYDISAIDKAFVNEFFAYLQGFNRKDDKKQCTTNGALRFSL